MSDAFDTLAMPATGGDGDEGTYRPHGSCPPCARTGLVGPGPAMQGVLALVARYARTGENVLVTGETGTGKELVARAVHALSPRAGRPFVAANVAALGEGMLLSELFGHERGAFTGALSRHPGLFEQADGGTLFLDEVGDLPAAQAALLRAIETRRVRAVGATRERPVDVRLVAATHRDLARMVRCGTFREDLYYRLNLLVVAVPALRYRMGDLRALARHALALIAPEHGPRRLGPGAFEALADYAWPGNVRQLQNVLRRMAASTDDAALTAAHVRAALAFERDGAAVGREAATTATVLAALGAEGGNVTRAARRLGIARSTVRAHLRRAGQGPNT